MYVKGSKAVTNSLLQKQYKSNNTILYFTIWLYKIFKFGDLYTKCNLKNTLMIHFVLRTKDLLEMIIIFCMNVFVKKNAERMSVRFCAAEIYNLLAKQNLITTFDNCTVNDISKSLSQIE